MKAFVQRVSSASVTVDQKVISRIDHGILVLLGIGYEDAQEDIDWLVNKVAQLRIFNDENDVMNKSIIDKNGDMIVVSQFTLMASTKKGNRPSYIEAAKPETAIPLYEKFIISMELKLSKKVGTGVFGGDMKVDLCNDGPVTILLDSKNKV